MSSSFVELSLSAAAWALTYLLHSTLFLGATWVALRVARTASHRVRDRVWKVALLAGLATATLQVGLGLEPLGGRFALQDGVHSVEPAAPTGFQSPTPTPDAAPGFVEDEEPSLDAETRPHARPATRSPREHDESFPVHLVRASSAAGRVQSASSWIEVESAEPSLRSSVDPRAERNSASIPAPARAGRPLRVVSTKGSGFGAWAASFSFAWALGIVVSVLGILFAVLRLQRGLRGRRPLRSGEAVRLLADLARRAGLSRRVELSVSDYLATPVTFGPFRPEICVPARALALRPDELEAMLAHELGHAVRRDPLWQLVARGIASTLFFQPLNRIAAAELADAAEYLSDDWAVAHTGRRLSLASCLTEVATWIVGTRSTLPAPAMADGKHRLGRRVCRLLEDDESVRTVSTDRLALFCAAAIVAGVLVVPGFASSAGEEPQDSLTIEHAPSELGPELDDTRERPMFGGAVPGPNPVDSTANALGALDLQIALLGDEVRGLRAAILELDEPDVLLDSVQIIERRIVQLRERREQFVAELPRLAKLLESREREAASH